MNNQGAERRARSVALLGLSVQVVLALIYTFLAVWSESQAVRVLTLLTAIGTPLWLFLVLVYHQRALVQDEAFETEELRRERQSGLLGGAIFDVDNEQLLLAKRRLAWMYRWMLPAFTIAIIALLVTAALVKWSWSLSQFPYPADAVEWPAIKESAVNYLVWFVGGLAFVSFLLSRYVVGMARQPEWRMLRAGASYLMGITLIGVALAATLGIWQIWGTPTPERVLAYAVRILLLVLAFEIGLNFVLDFYRPRTAEEEPRPAFDSRLLGLFSEPGGIARSIADAINYQFGFEVSSTWFYKLLERSVVPLIGFAILTLFGASCFIFVRADEQVVVLRFGSKHAILEPGLHFKMPWPIDTSMAVATQQIHEMKIGKKDRTDEAANRNQLILWTNEHNQDPHLEVLVATPRLVEFWDTARMVTASAPAEETPATAPAETLTDVQAVPVSLLRVSVALHYRILNAYDWISTHKDPEVMLESLATRAINQYCASLDVPYLMGQKQSDIEQTLQTRIQQDADHAKLGVKIELLALQGVHPPTSVAESFQDVIGAEQKSTASVRSARVEYNKKLSESAGDVRRAEELATAIQRINALESTPDSQPKEVTAAREQVHRLFFGDANTGMVAIGGEAAGRIVKAQAERWRQENQAHGEAIAFEQEKATCDAAPNVYRLRKYLEALIQGVQGRRKYIFATENRPILPTYQINLQDPLSAPLDVSLEEINP